MPPSPLRSIGTPEVPEVLRASPRTIETVQVSIDASIPLARFLGAIAGAGLTVRSDGNGGILITQAEGSQS